jgi:hypothetical protein
MPRNSDFHSGNIGAKNWSSIVVKLCPDDRARLVKLTHDRGKTASAVIRELLRDASELELASEAR